MGAHFACSITELIGNTPIIVLQHSLVPEGKSLLIKLEQFNPGLSVKDRTALGLIQRAFDSGRLHHGDVVIESTSGNLGKSLAMLSACLGFKLIVVVDAKLSRKDLNWLKAFGARVEVVTDSSGSGGLQRARIERVKKLLLENEGAFWPNQYENPDNPRYHQEVTAREFFDVPAEMLVGAVSTGGHFSGIAKGVKGVRPEVKCMACDIEGSAIFGGTFHPYWVNGIGLSWRAGNTDQSNFDFVNIVSDQEAFSICRLLARDVGLFFGGSSGATIFSALLALRYSEFSRVLAIAPDSGVNYLDQFYDDSWLAERNIELMTMCALKQRLEEKGRLALRTAEAPTGSGAFR
jgi:cysteine synthase